MGCSYHQGFGYPLNFGISSPFLKRIALGFVSSLRPLIFGGFDYPENKLITRGYPHHQLFGYPLQFGISSPFTIWNVFRVCKFACLFIVGGFGYPELNKRLKYKQTLFKGILISLGGIICTFFVSPHFQQNYSPVYFIFINSDLYLKLKKTSLGAKGTFPRQNLIEGMVKERAIGR